MASRARDAVRCWRCTECREPVQLRGVSAVKMARDFPELDDETLQSVAEHSLRWYCSPCKTRGFLTVGL